MTRLVCRSCGATWLSQPAVSLIRSHDGRCLRCESQVQPESENERLIRQYFDALNDRDEDAVAALLAPTVVIRPAAPVAGMSRTPPSAHGLAAAIEGFRALKERFPAWLFTLRTVEEHPEERVLCEGSVSVTDLDGRQEAIGVFWIIRMRDRRIAEVSSFDRAEVAPHAL